MNNDSILHSSGRSDASDRPTLFFVDLYKKDFSLYERFLSPGFLLLSAPGRGHTSRTLRYTADFFFVVDVVEVANVAHVLNEILRSCARKSTLWEKVNYKMEA